MKYGKSLVCAVLLSAATVGCIFPACKGKDKSDVANNGTQVEDSVVEDVVEEEVIESPSNPQPEPQPQPVEVKAQYVIITADSVNIRSGAGTNYSVLGSAEKNTLYAILGKSGSWYKTYYKNKIAYISDKYCKVTELAKSQKDVIEEVILFGYQCLGEKYVYGAVRYIDSKGNRIQGFTTSKFDCSSLMQYIFKCGANINLRENTRTQIYQGTAVKGSDLRRGDLLFFTNDARKNNTGIERVGHVALYLGNNYILHTASDYAKIETVSDKRWSYFIQAKRML